MNDVIKSSSVYTLETADERKDAYGNYCHIGSSISFSRLFSTSFYNQNHSATG